jgi:hypothetical protein
MERHVEGKQRDWTVIVSETTTVDKLGKGR